MAVDVTGNPWELLAADASATPIWPPGGKGVGNVFVENIEFINYGADTDVLIIKDGNGKTVWEANGAADLRPVRSGKIGWVNKGLIVSTMDSGKVLIFHK